MLDHDSPRPSFTILNQRPVLQTLGVSVIVPPLRLDSQCIGDEQCIIHRASQMRLTARITKPKPLGKLTALGAPELEIL